jgi:hypothetical protein
MTNNAEQVAELLYSTPESVRTAKGQTPEALAFQIAAAALDTWPADVEFNAFSAKLINGGALDTALTIYLRTLAEM